MPFQDPALLIGVSARIYYPSGPVLDLGGVPRDEGVRAR
jgi:putative glutamine amidotransferase